MRCGDTCRTWRTVPARGRGSSGAPRTPPRGASRARCRPHAPPAARAAKVAPLKSSNCQPPPHFCTQYSRTNLAIFAPRPAASEHAVVVGVGRRRIDVLRRTEGPRGHGVEDRSRGRPPAGRCLGRPRLARTHADGRGRTRTARDDAGADTLCGAFAVLARSPPSARACSPHLQCCDSERRGSSALADRGERGERAVRGIPARPSSSRTYSSSGRRSHRPGAEVEAVNVF